MTEVNEEAPASTNESSTRKPKRSPKEIAQGHADTAVKALEKHDEKVGKLDAKINKIEAERVELEAKREQLVLEADYRQAHPLLREAQDVSDPF